MSAAKSESSERQHQRYAIVSRVRVRMDSWDEFEELYTNNVSRGGLFVRMERPVPVGTRLSVELSDAGGRTMVLPAEVAHTADVDGSLGRGVGLRFLALSGAEREIVDALITDARSVRAVGSVRDAALAANVPDLLARLRTEVERLSRVDAYSAFDLSPLASRAELDEARRRIIKRWHPSNYPRESREVLDAATEICRTLNGLWASIRD